MPKSVCPNFDNIDVSTKTIIGISNVFVNIENIFGSLHTKEYHVVKKKRGRRKKDAKETNPNQLSNGDIISLKYRDNVKGVDLKKKSRTNKFFRNALTVVMYVGDKFINFKLSQNGKFQITGAKKTSHAIDCIKIFWRYVKDLDGLYSYKDDKDKVFRVSFLTVMTNIDFNIGFNVDREKLDTYINEFTKYNSLLEMSFGYTGVNIKFPIQETLDFYLNRINYIDGKWVSDTITYKDYLNSLSEVEYTKQITKNRYNTFLVFHSGNVIMSGMIKKYMKDEYNRFINIIKQSRTDIEEKLDT